MPIGNAKHTEKHKDVIEELKKSPEVSRLVGHSLASAVINKIIEEQSSKFATATYATPSIKKKREGKQDPRRCPNDVVSMLDGYAETSNFVDWNPVIAHTYKKNEGQGMWHIRPTTAISKGIHPNQPIKI